MERLYDLLRYPDSPRIKQRHARGPTHEGCTTEHGVEWGSNSSMTEARFPGPPTIEGTLEARREYHWPTIFEQAFQWSLEVGRHAENPSILKSFKTD